MSGSGLLAGASRSTGVVLLLATFPGPAFLARRAGMPQANGPEEAVFVAPDAAFGVAIGFLRGGTPLSGS